MKLTTGILLTAMALGTAWGQNPDVIQNTRDTMKAIEQKKANDSNAALASSPEQARKPAPSAPGQAATSQPASGKASTSKAAVAPQSGSTPKATAQTASSKSKATATGKKKASRRVERVAVEDKRNPEAKKEAPKVVSLTGRRDPFISPVVNRSMVGSGCSTGKKCLAIDQISLKGVVKAEAGMIAVVVNAMDKAYFLRENDPVFNGYVMKITGDSVIFKETVQDKLGKPFTREVTKKITTPAV